MPNDNIERAIKKGTGELDGELLVEGGCRFVLGLVDVIVEEREVANRPAGDDRESDEHTDHGDQSGGATGCVAERHPFGGGP